ncbi:hypothetical protein OR16_34723 [Cupriavidus basilensis OR16]|uniref:Uncharacterized protein n=1 Tax=Cupriavidus basilensis OR16 TaxID=1127483 RepID=H1SF43_9BURK|nr:hypothetical protein [Cupriavidus basilensis]EHP38868.1 hypothetical protein OR16_34723 [Cupriavidus basilensis OR16]
MSYSIGELEDIIERADVKLAELGASYAKHLEDTPSDEMFEIGFEGDETEQWADRAYWYMGMIDGLRERRAVLEAMLEELNSELAVEYEEQSEEWLQDETIRSDYETSGGTWNGDGEPEDPDLWAACVNDFVVSAGKERQ